MASVSVDDVRDVINISSAEVPDFKITNMIKRAEVTLELETDKQIDYGICTDAEKEFITVLAAIYVNCLVKISVVGEVASQFWERHIEVVINSLYFHYARDGKLCL